MQNRIMADARTDIGCVRKNNEDAFILYIPTEGQWALLGVIDGVGGYEGGEIAAAITKEYIEKEIENLGDRFFDCPEENIVRIANRANNAVCEARKENEQLARMSCVMSFSLLDSEKEQLYFAHVGDTRGYLLRQQELIKITSDHSIVGCLEESGSLTEEEAMRHPRRNEVSKMLGEKMLADDDKKYIDTGVYSYYPGDILLFCSDGLTDLVSSAKINEIIGSSETIQYKLEQLIEEAKTKGGRDNITVALGTYNKEKKGALEKISSSIPVVEMSEAETTAIEKEFIKTPKTKKRSTVSVFTLLVIVILAFILGFMLNLRGSVYWAEQVFKPNKIIATDTIRSGTNLLNDTDSLIAIPDNDTATVISVSDTVEQ